MGSKVTVRSTVGSSVPAMGKNVGSAVSGSATGAKVGSAVLGLADRAAVGAEVVGAEVRVAVGATVVRSVVVGSDVGALVVIWSEPDMDGEGVETEGALVSVLEQEREEHPSSIARHRA